ncbi:MAG: hypothetical protein HOP12_12255, partial [Candidatus Eisenbacteria bacterium]|nr:hypothetical protein [Candidatus Eisenbacteria bacterium]
MSSGLVAELCRFAIAASAGDAAAIRRVLARVRRARRPRAAFEEVALMLTLYASYPAAIESLRLLGLEWPQATKAGEVPVATRRRRGLATLAAVYGGVADSVRAALRSHHPALEAWVIEHAYGRVLSRGALEMKERELVTLALLV